MRLAAFMVPALVAGAALPALAQPVKTKDLAAFQSRQVIGEKTLAELEVEGPGAVTLRLQSAQNEFITIHVTATHLQVDWKHAGQVHTRHRSAQGGDVDAREFLTEVLEAWHFNAAIKEEARKAAVRFRHEAEVSSADRAPLLAWAEVLDNLWVRGILTRRRDRPAPAPTSPSPAPAPASPAAPTSPQASPAPDPAYLVEVNHAADLEPPAQAPLGLQESLSYDLLMGGHTAEALQRLQRRIHEQPDAKEDEATFEAFTAFIRDHAGLVFKDGQFQKAPNEEKETKKKK